MNAMNVISIFRQDKMGGCMDTMNAMTLYKGLMVTQHTMGVAGDMAVTDYPRVIFISSRVPAADVCTNSSFLNNVISPNFFSSAFFIGKCCNFLSELISWYIFIENNQKLFSMITFECIINL